MSSDVPLVGLSVDQLAELEVLAMAAYQSPWEIGRSGTGTLEDACAWVSESIGKNDNPELWGVFTGPPGDDKTVALTGNASYSFAHAQYIAALNPSTVLALIANLRLQMKAKA